MASRKKSRRKPKPKEITHLVATNEDLFALTDDGLVYKHVDDGGTYGWDELPVITEETIMNLEVDGDDEE